MVRLYLVEVEVRLEFLNKQIVHESNKSPHEEKAGDDDEGGTIVVVRR